MFEHVLKKYPDLDIVLRDLVDSTRDILDYNFVGAYLQGSLAVGGFDIHSDVDFIMVVEDEPSDKHIQALQIMHERIYGIDISWAQHLEGSYFPKEILRQHDNCTELLWYLEHGSRSLEKSTHCNSIVVRWTVRENGITLAGPPPSTLIDPIPVEKLRMEIKSTMFDWGKEIIDNPEKFNNRFYQSFIVITYCRMMRDLHEGFPGAKRAGTDWAKANLDPVWNGLIDRAWDGRPNPSVSIRQPADPDDFQSTLKFIQYAIDKSNLKL